MQSASEQVIPAGMKPWSGGDSAPEDYVRGKVMFRNGALSSFEEGPWNWRDDGELSDIIAYTPSPAPMVEQAGELKACPFCGGEAVRREYDERHPYEPFGLVVDHTDSCFLLTSLDWDSVYTRWNTRPAPAATERKDQQHRLCLLIEEYCPNRGDYDHPLGNEVEVLADKIIAAGLLVSTPPADAGMLREALINLESAGSNVLKAIDSYNEANGTALGGAPFIVLGRRIAAARSALACLSPDGER